LQDITLILLAAGQSSRFAQGVKKQWLYQSKIPLWLHVAQNFEHAFDFYEIIIVGSHDEIAYMEQFADYRYVAGGNTRQQSVDNALAIAKSKYVLINDVARCCLDTEMVHRVIEQRSSASCIAPSLKVTDTVYMGDNPIDRDQIMLIQTPQICLTSSLRTALDNDEEFTDESTAIKSLGEKVVFVEGSIQAHKLTHKSDLDKLSCLKEPSNDMMIGFGIDIHPFQENKQMKLCGIQIDSSVGLKAHSDGDVALHALIDALMGAANMGDIGEMFPDTDSAYADADSAKLTKEVVKKIIGYGFEINNIDMTIMAEKPRISKYKKAMQKSIADLLHIPKNRVNIKATTAEKLGFVGREEGITVHAVASIKYYNWRENI